MNIVRWIPWRDRSGLNNRINRFFDDTFLPTSWLNEDFGKNASRVCVNPKIGQFHKQNKEQLNREEYSILGSHYLDERGEALIINPTFF